MGLFAAVVGLATTSSPRADAGGPATIVLEVSTFRNSNGFLGCQLYADGAGFPDNWPSQQATFHKRVPVTGPTTSCTYTSLPPGTYAATVIHDENANGKLDTNFLGVPKEAYGVSNNHTHALKRPTWDESKFVVNADSTVTAHISLRY
jgi:uncharacterized protein (DUF2141 family)